MELTKKSKRAWSAILIFLGIFIVELIYEYLHYSNSWSAVIGAALGPTLIMIIIGLIAEVIYSLVKRLKFSLYRWVKITAIIFGISIVSWIIQLQKERDDISSFNQIEWKNYSSNPLTVNNRVYHSNTNDYRFKLPSGWSIQKGESLGVEFNAFSLNNSAMLIVQIGNFPTESNFEISKVPDDFIKGLPKTELVDDFEVIHEEFTHIANQKTKETLFRISYKHLDKAYTYVIDSYMFVYRNRLYNLLFKSEADSFSSNKEDFKAILMSFYLE